MAVRILGAILLVIVASGCDKLIDKINSVGAAESWKWSAPRVAETKRRGEIICHAIDAYRAKTGKYPSRLEDLQPGFLREIPQPTVGYKQWDYMLIDNGSDYQLKVVASEFGPSLDKTAREHWKYADNHGERDI